jgi:hypothetical protein
MLNPTLDQVDDARCRVQVNILPSRSAKRNAGVWDIAGIQDTLLNGSIRLNQSLPGQPC